MSVGSWVRSTCMAESTLRPTIYPVEILCAQQLRLDCGGSGNIVENQSTAPVKALDQHRELRPGQCHRSILDLRPDEPAVLEPLGQQPRILAMVPLQSRF